MKIVLDNREIDILVSKRLEQWYNENGIKIYANKCTNKLTGYCFYARISGWDEISYLSVKEESFENSLENLKSKILGNPNGYKI